MVYSASCNFSFPILYKLDRDTGACDVITMDWLLNADSQPNWTQPNGDNKNSGGALESILKSMTSRQSGRPGVGARLFVQACVLAGCDYCPSQLNGVGLVTAFKLVRDNVHRPAADRFRKALKSLPKKARSNINVNDYEELLSKSEAVFYYHPVFDMDTKSIIPLMAPKTCEEVNESELEMVSDNHPSMHRFGEDWSFLGDMTNLKQDDKALDDYLPVSEIVIAHNKPDRKKKMNTSKVAPTKYDGGEAAVAAVMKTVVNPYAKKRKRSDDGLREPLTTIDTTIGHSQSKTSNPFSKFSHKQKNTTKDSERQKSMGLSMYVNNRQDVRFVKRNFRAKPPSYTKMLSQKGPQGKSGSLPKSVGQSSVSGRHSGRALERNSLSSGAFASQQRVDDSIYNSSSVTSLRQTGDVDATGSMMIPSHQTDDGQESNRHFTASQPKLQSIAEQEENSFCYGETDPANAAGNNLFQEPVENLFSQVTGVTERHEMHAPEMDHHHTRVGYEAGYGEEPFINRDVSTDTLPFGNPDLAYDTHESNTCIFMDQHASRRVTLEDADTALYNEFVAVDGNGRLLNEEQFDDEEQFDEYQSQLEPTVRSFDNASQRSYATSDLRDDVHATSKYFSASKPSSRRVTLEEEINEFDAAHINGSGSQHDAHDDFLDKPSHTGPFSSRMESTICFSRHKKDISRSDDCLSASSCDDVASPDHQNKSRPRFNNFSWAGKHSQEEQVVITPRQPKLAPIRRQAKDVPGTLPGIQRSPLSVTSATYYGSMLNVESRPAFQNQARSRGRNKSAIRPPNRGAITNFFPVKSPENEFATF